MTSSPSSPTPETGVPVCYRHPQRETHIRCQRCNRPICPDCMRDAAVGFQCPNCVAEGRKTTRSGRTAYGGLRPTDASRTSIAIIAVNVVVFIAINVGSSSVLHHLWLLPHGFTSNTGVTYPGVSDGAAYQLLTSLFAHQYLWHIGFNMYALYILGPQLELAVGRARFVALYLLSGLTGSVVVYVASDQFGPTLGASGAIFGLLGALLVMAHKVGGDVRGLLTLIAINAVITLVVPNISWQGHLGGFVGGVLIGGILVYAPRDKRTVYQVAGLSALGVLLVVATVLRTAALS